MLTKTERKRLLKRHLEIQQKLNGDEDEAWLAKHRSLVGQCFKYRNSFGGGDESWFLYAKVTGIEDFHLKMLTFQHQANGLIQVELCHLTAWMSESYQPIPENEFWAAWLSLSKTINSVDVLRP